MSQVVVWTDNAGWVCARCCREWWYGLTTPEQGHQMKIKLPKLKCKRCGHQWTPRGAEVRICPKCKSAWWDKRKGVEGGSHSA